MSTITHFYPTNDSPIDRIEIHAKGANTQIVVIAAKDTGKIHRRMQQAATPALVAKRQEDNSQEDNSTILSLYGLPRVEKIVTKLHEGKLISPGLCQELRECLDKIRAVSVIITNAV